MPEIKGVVLDENTIIGVDEMIRMAAQAIAEAEAALRNAESQLLMTKNSLRDWTKSRIIADVCQIPNLADGCQLRLLESTVATDGIARNGDKITFIVQKKMGEPS